MLREKHLHFQLCGAITCSPLLFNSSDRWFSIIKKMRRSRSTAYFHQSLMLEINLSSKYQYNNNKTPHNFLLSYYKFQLNSFRIWKKLLILSANRRKPQLLQEFWIFSVSMVLLNCWEAQDVFTTIAVLQHWSAYFSVRCQATLQIHLWLVTDRSSAYIHIWLHMDLRPLLLKYQRTYGISISHLVIRASTPFFCLRRCSIRFTKIVLTFAHALKNAQQKSFWTMDINDRSSPTSPELRTLTLIYRKVTYWIL